MISRRGFCGVAAEGGRMFCLCLFFFILTFNVFCQTNYLNIYRTDLQQICKLDRTTAVDERSEVSFVIPQGPLPLATSFVGLLLQDSALAAQLSFSDSQQTAVSIRE